MIDEPRRAPSARPGLFRPSTLRRLAVLGIALGALGARCNGTNLHEPVGHQTFSSPQAQPIVLSSDGALLFVAHTTSNRVSVVSTASLQESTSIPVGLEPVALAIKPDGSELWVSNHVSDSVSVIDLDSANDTFLKVVATVQDIDANGVTQFDEPVGIAFASDAKAYVALSSRNDVAVVDTATYEVTSRIHITAQEPRALRVVGDRLYVAAFESNNQSELSICPDGPLPGETDPANQCTLGLDDLVDFVLVSPNIPGSDARIVIDPDNPDRDLFVIDTTTDLVDESVSGVGTLLYDLAVSSTGRVFVTQTHARNAENGGDNTGGSENLVALDNRMFLNQIGRVDCTAASCVLDAGGPIELEPLPPSQPAAGDQLATPYGIQISDDDSTLVATAAGTSRVFTVDAASGAVRDILDLDAGVAADFGQQIPKGVALYSDGVGAPQTAYVLNTLENTVSVVDVSNPDALVHVTKIPVGLDPTPEDVRRGRIAFNNAFASTTGTFSCESCHPDGHTDQLLWRIGGPCFFGACSGHDEIRSTMPVRGLRNTLPLHWDGTLGDPFGGSNGEVGNGGNGGTDCNLGGPDGDLDCFRDLVDGSLSGVMCSQGSPAPACPNGPSGQAGLLTDSERDDLAVFLASVAYPPPRERPIDDVVSTTAANGFADFFLDKGGAGSIPELPQFDQGVRTCADMDSGCHALPLGADTNSISLAGFDAPTMRGMTDRWLQFSIGITNAQEVLEFVKVSNTINLQGFEFPAPATTIPFDPLEGFEEDVTFAAAFQIFQPVYFVNAENNLQMFEEASTGFSGAVGRQVTLNADTADPGSAPDTDALLASLEAADARGSVNLRGYGMRDAGAGSNSLLLSYRASVDEYRNQNDTVVLTRTDLMNEAAAGTLVMTFTAELSQHFGKDDFRQPLLSVTSIADGPDFTNPAIPLLTTSGAQAMTLVGIDVRDGTAIVVDGAVVSGSVTCDGGSFAPYCDSQTVTVTLDTAPAAGLHLLQLQNPGGPLSNELPICSGDGLSTLGCLVVP